MQWIPHIQWISNEPLPTFHIHLLSTVLSEFLLNLYIVLLRIKEGVLKQHSWVHSHHFSKQPQVRACIRNSLHNFGLNIWLLYTDTQRYASPFPAVPNSALGTKEVLYKCRRLRLISRKCKEKELNSGRITVVSWKQGPVYWFLCKSQGEAKPSPLGP